MEPSLTISSIFSDIRCTDRNLVWVYGKSKKWSHVAHLEWRQRGCVCVSEISRFSRVWLFATPWSVACQAPLFMGFFRQEYWRGLPLTSPGDLPDPGIKLTSLVSPALAGRFFTTSTTWEGREDRCEKPIELIQQKLALRAQGNGEKLKPPSLPESTKKLGGRGRVPSHMDWS